MPKPKNKRFSKQTWFVAGVVIVLAAVCGVLTFTLNYRDTPAAYAPTLAERVSVGAMAYRFENDRAIKRTDAAVQDMRAFLVREADRSGCPANRPGYEHVVTYTQDETQALLKYGCGAADSTIFAVKKEGAWKTLSPTNHFDLYGIPECSYLTDNNISKEIAPVCVSDLDQGSPTYTAR